MKMNILFFTEISPFPINGGERIRSYGLLKALSSLDYNVTAVIQNQNQVDLESYKMINVKYIEYENSKLTHFDTIFSKYFFSKSKNVITIFESLIIGQKFDLVILDFNLAGRYSPYFKSRKIPIIIGTHNAESNLIWQKPTVGVIEYLRKIQHFLAMYVHERIFYKNADTLITVSDEDSNFYSIFYPRKQICLIPNFLDESRYTMSLTRGNYFIMTANFGAYMNYEGLKWLILEVWNDEIDSNNRLFLVGKKSIESLERLKKIKNYKNIVAIGSVDDVTPYISKAKAVFIPLLHGSGSRLKCLEAMALQTPIIATSKGVEGVKSTSIIIANKAEEFRESIKKYEYNPEIGPKLYKDFINQYSLKSNTKTIQNLMDNFKPVNY
jgi:glycosyltransferase involved in cell wall biosynthesis